MSGIGAARNGSPVMLSEAREMFDTVGQRRTWTDNLAEVEQAFAL